MVPELHSRAAAWYEANGLPETAIEHAQRAGDADRVARLVLAVANPVWASGRLDTVLRWMEWFSANGVDRAAPGRRRARRADLRARRHARRRRALGVGRRAHDRSPARSPTATPWRARWPTCGRCCAAGGSTQMRRDAQVALDGLSPTSPYRAGDAARPGRRPTCSKATPTGPTCSSREPLTRRRAPDVVPFIPLVLAERGIVAIERDDWSEAEALAAAGDGDHGGRPVRRLLDERSRLRLGAPVSPPIGAT